MGTDLNIVSRGARAAWSTYIVLAGFIALLVLIGVSQEAGPLLWLLVPLLLIEVWALRRAWKMRLVVTDDEVRIQNFIGQEVYPWADIRALSKGIVWLFPLPPLNTLRFEAGSSRMNAAASMALTRRSSKEFDAIVALARLHGARVDIDVSWLRR